MIDFLTSDEFRQAFAEFKEQLDFFVFFHLGSDAVVRCDRSPAGVEVSISHPRIEDFQFRLASEELAALVGDSDQLEEFLLGHLTRHRRHR